MLYNPRTKKIYYHLPHEDDRGMPTRAEDIKEEDHVSDSM